MNVRKELISKELREECRVLWRTQVDWEKPLGALKMRSMLEAQKAVAHLRCTREAGGDKERLGKAEEVGRTVEKVEDPGIRRIRGRLQGRGRQQRGMGPGSFCGKLTACTQYAGSAEGCGGPRGAAERRGGRGSHN